MTGLWRKSSIHPMKRHHEPHPDSVNSRLARSLSAEREPIINEWLNRIRDDPRIPTGSLTTEALKNHVPCLLDDLTETLRHYDSETVAERTGSDALVHGTTRWRQGYALPAMMREIKHLRAILIRHLQVFEEENEELGIASRLFVSTTLHAFLDDVEIDASRQFLIAGHQAWRETEYWQVSSAA